MTKKTKKLFDFIEKNMLRCEVSYRGGGIEIDASEILGEGVKMTAYQNYLGGGIAGKICSATNSDIPVKLAKKHSELEEVLKMYFYSLNAGGGDDYMVENVNSYKGNQKMPVSAY